MAQKSGKNEGPEQGTSYELGRPQTAEDTYLKSDLRTFFAVSLSFIVLFAILFFIDQKTQFLSNLGQNIIEKLTR